jgi:hypothetical protein
MPDPHGPEFQNGWFKEIRHERLGYCLIRADHHSRSRVPRGHEIVRQLSRGRHPLELIREVDFRWTVFVQRRRIADIFRVPSGLFRTTMSGRLLWPTVEKAAASALNGHAMTIHGGSQDPH